MQLNTGLKAYQEKINLPLFNDIVAFVLETAEVAITRRFLLCQRCPFMTLQTSTLQEKYGFLYLGELLERYEERFGMDIQDLRAIALALGYTHEFVTEEMFVGPQKDNFLRKVRKMADGDIYLSGALLLVEGREVAAEQEQKLTNGKYDATEDVLFALSLFYDDEQTFLRFKPHLLKLLGMERTMPVLGNVTALNWLIIWLAPQIKGTRGKDTALFRALCALPASHVKTDSVTHRVLLKYGYTPLEIGYANMMIVLTQTADNCLRTDSITSEKIAVDLFREVFSAEEPLAQEFYDQLTQVYRRYEQFSIRCYDCKRLEEALRDGICIQNVTTFLWFSSLVDITHRAFSSFDIMDTKWDLLASTMEPEEYRSLFETCLNPNMSPDEIQRRLDRYQELTRENYASIYWESTCGRRFKLLIDKELLDLWSLFQRSLDENGCIVKVEMLYNIWGYVRNNSTVQAYAFFRRFFASYGAAGLKTFFGDKHCAFCAELTERQPSYSYGSQDIVGLKLRREYLDEDSHRQLLHWLEDYIFTYQPEQYLNLLSAILRDDFTAGLFSKAEQRQLFDVLTNESNVSKGALDELKHRYMTEAELQAERDAEAAAHLEAEHRQQMAVTQSIREHYEGLLTDSFSSVIKFLKKYIFRDQERLIAYRIAREGLDKLLDAKCYELESQEAVLFFRVCAKLLKQGSMQFSEVQEYIAKIRECAV